MEEDVETCEHSLECELRDAYYDDDDDYDDELHGSVDGNDVLFLLLHIRVSVSRW